MEELLGYSKAKSMMKYQGWQLLVTVDRSTTKLERAKLIHQSEQTQYRIRRDSAKRLMQECYVVCARGYDSAVMALNARPPVRTPSYVL